MPESADPGAKFVEVYSKTTGVKQTVPERFLNHPVLSQGIRKTPLSEKQQRDADAAIAKANTITDTAAAAGQE